MASVVVVEWRRRKDRMPRREAIGVVEVLHKAILCLFGVLERFTSRFEDEK